jgi:hypothetical protein
MGNTRLTGGLMDDLLQNKTNYELIESLLKEVAKSANEIKCAEADLRKAQSRVGFALLLINVLLERAERDQDDYK